ncbi:transglycosylase family protein, partial [Streptomyces prasinus]
MCESDGDWQANTGNGHYGGLQFTQSSWTAGWRPAVWCRGSPRLSARVPLPGMHRLPVTAP